MGRKGGRRAMRRDATCQSPISRRAWHTPNFWFDSRERMHLRYSCEVCVCTFVNTYKRNEVWVKTILLFSFLVMVGCYSN